jgi:hypothetical protein
MTNLESLLYPNENVLLILLIIAGVRVYLEILGVDLSKLPVSKSLGKYSGEESLRKFHRSGLIFSLGFILFYAPGLFF